MKKKIRNLLSDLKESDSLDLRDDDLVSEIKMNI